MPKQSEPDDLFQAIVLLVLTCSVRLHKPNLLPPEVAAQHTLRFAPDADGWMPVSLRFDIEEAACAYVLGFGAQMEVVEPIELRDRVLQAAKEAIAFHSSLQDRRISSPIAGDTFS